MRNLTLLLFLLSSVCFAGNYVKKSDLDLKLANCDYAITVHSKKKPGLIPLPHKFDCKTFAETDEMVDDETKPNWGTRSMIVSCEGEINCKAMALEIACTDGRHALYNAEYSEVWCNKILSYIKKKSGRKLIKVDADKKLAFLEAKSAAKAAKKAKKDEIIALKLKLKSEDLNASEINTILKFILEEVK